MRTANILMGLGCLAGTWCCCDCCWAAADRGAVGVWAVFAVLTALNGLAAGSFLACGLFGRNRDQ